MFGFLKKSFPMFRLGWSIWLYLLNCIAIIIFFLILFKRNNKFLFILSIIILSWIILNLGIIICQRIFILDASILIQQSFPRLCYPRFRLMFNFPLNYFLLYLIWFYCIYCYYLIEIIELKNNWICYMIYVLYDYLLICLSFQSFRLALI